MARAAKKGNPIVRYLRETRSELRKVIWPTRQEATNLTIIVIAATVAMSIVLAIADLIFTRAFSWIIAQEARIFLMVAGLISIVVVAFLLWLRRYGS